MTIESFTSMDRSTRQQWSHIAHESMNDWATTPTRVLTQLRALEPIHGGFAVNQLIHVTQTATRAERAGADDELVVAALCHDIAKSISEPNHPAVAAALLAPFVRAEVAWTVEVHQDFQGAHYFEFIGQDPAARENHAGHPAYALAERFADEWDQTSFDPAYDTLPLEHFEPVVRRVFAEPRYW